MIPTLELWNIVIIQALLILMPICFTSIYFFAMRKKKILDSNGVNPIIYMYFCEIAAESAANIAPNGGNGEA